ncbi:cell division protein FtsA [Gammaproteobacteria bacterium]|jgi:cell division protein FtsA|nr:cell division protein FtsA [Gammaproteobacteria bacterium]MDA9143285.1 cell division protein FtsA [Gammaproteobacteria bacterium]MDA9997671.1 cell division protein FtsA [Gammaproteobacteria bacterium]MDC3247410.1 cell division protein FtsA [Gammaproteobacteria bacterium]MDC3301869.1 cell division protein FtsA [Gammaproteobacteria bacterium]
MGNSKNSNIVVGLDIGTSKVVCIVGTRDENGQLEIISLGSYPSSGLKKGVVVNIEATTDAIKKAVEQAQSIQEDKIKSIYVGVAGSHIKSINSQGIVGIKDKEVKPFDIEKVIESASSVSIPSDQEVLHVLPQEYVIDDQDGIKEPLGMSGVRLEARVHLVTCSNSALRNIEKCVKNCGLSVDGFVLEQLASSYSILSDDEKDLGVCLVDIGGGTTDIAIFNSGSIVHTGVIPIAGDQVTSDIAQALRTPTPQAEEIKQKHGCSVAEFTNDDESIEVPGVGGRPPRELSRRSLAEIIEPRYVELFELIKAEISRNGFDDKIPAGVVFTGGTSKIEGVVELAESIFQTSVRLGVPNNFVGMERVLQNPIYSTSIGLVEHGHNQLTSDLVAESNQTLWSKLLKIVKSEY